MPDEAEASRIALDQKVNAIKAKAEKLKNEGERLGMLAALRDAVEQHFDHGYDAATSDGKNREFAIEVGLVGAAAIALAAQEKPDPSLQSGIAIEIFPFKSLPANQAKVAFREYVVSKYFPEHTDWQLLNKALLIFADGIFKESKNNSDPDEFIYRMIYQEAVDWQRYAAKEISAKDKYK